MFCKNNKKMSIITEQAVNNSRLAYSRFQIFELVSNEQSINSIIEIYFQPFETIRDLKLALWQFFIGLSREFLRLN